jgi:hypothetical protein
MRKLLILLSIVLPLSIAAQDEVDKLFDKYSGKDGFTTVNISGKMLGFVAQFEQDNHDAKDMMEQLSGIKILSVDDEALNHSLDFFEELGRQNFFKKIEGEYEMVMDIKESSQVVKFYLKKSKGGKVGELLMIVGGDSNAIISIRGDFDMKDLSKLGSSLHMDGLEHLDKIDK